MTVEDFVVTGWCQNLCVQLRTLQQNYMFCDSIIISGEDDIFPLHTCILVAVTQKGILPEPSVEAPHFSLRLENVPSKVVERLVNFLYSGYLDQDDLTQKEKKYLVASSRSLGINGLVGGQVFSKLEAKALGKDAKPKETVAKKPVVENKQPEFNGGANADENFFSAGLIGDCSDPWQSSHLDPDLLTTPSDLLLQNKEFFLGDVNDSIKYTDGENMFDGIHLPTYLKDDTALTLLSTEVKPSLQQQLEVESNELPEITTAFVESQEIQNNEISLPQKDHLVQFAEEEIESTESTEQKKYITIDIIKAEEEGHLKEQRTGFRKSVSWIKTKKNNSNFSYSQYVEYGETIVENGKRRYVCKQCGFTKTSMESFVVHKLQAHEGIIPFSCSKCSKGFYRKYDCNRHERNCSGKRKASQAPRWERNQLPNKMLTKVIAPGEDVKKDGRRKFYKCSLCSKVVLTYETFVSHKFEHANIRPFSCARCGQAFLRLSETRRHVFSAKSCKNSEDFDSVKQPVTEQDESIINAQGVLIDTNKVQQAVDILASMPPKNGPHEEKKTSIDELSQYVKEGETVWVNNFRMYKCSLCEKSMTTLNSFAAHKMKHANIFHYFCEVCKKGFRSKNALNRHLPMHLANDDLTCRMCATAFETQDELLSHMQTQEGCSTGWETAVDKSRVAKSNGCSLICKFCPKVFTCEEYLEKHLDLKHYKFVRPFRCDQCSISFRLEANYVAHMVKHIDGTSAFKCASCGKTFKRRIDFNSHILSHRRDYKCFNCNKTFKSVSSLKLHQAIHSGLKPFLCKICGKAFTQKGNLVKHERGTHAGCKNYSCSDCNRKFSSESGLRWHKKATHHKSLTSYDCSICQKRFPMKVKLQRHFVTHTNYKPFKCPLCSKFFRSKAHVQKHCKCIHKVTEDDLKTMNFKKVGNEKALSMYDNHPFLSMPKPKHIPVQVQNEHKNTVSLLQNDFTSTTSSDTSFSNRSEFINVLANTQLVRLQTSLPQNDPKVNEFSDSSILGNQDFQDGTDFEFLNGLFGESLPSPLSNDDSSYVSTPQTNPIDLFSNVDADGRILVQVIGEDGTLHYVRMKPELLLSQALTNENLPSQDTTCDYNLPDLPSQDTTCDYNLPDSEDMKIIPELLLNKTL